jgi:hypothetical protein
MARLSPPGTVVIMCPFPDRVAPAEAAAWLRLGDDPAMPVTWTVSPGGLERLRDLRESTPSTAARSAVAVTLDPTTATAKASLRGSIRQAQAAWPDLSAAVLHGGGCVVHRDVLVQQGIATLCVDAFDEPARGSRRPAPSGWPCRTMLWGLWEVCTTPRQRLGLVRRVARLWNGVQGLRGGLVILDAAAARLGPTATRARLERHLAWARRRIHAGALRGATLADLPRIIAGGAMAASPGSVLRAA